MSEGNLTGNVGAGLRDSWLPLPGTPFYPSLCQALGAEPEGGRRRRKGGIWREDGGWEEGPPPHRPTSPSGHSLSGLLNGLASAVLDTYV